jgi:hypothetical protein
VSPEARVALHALRPIWEALRGSQGDVLDTFSEGLLESSGCFLPQGIQAKGDVLPGSLISIKGKPSGTPPVCA